MSDPNKTVFLSYRRDVSKYIARTIYMDLRANGFDVFMDVENVDSGAFDRIILNQIAARAHFVVILTSGSVERCAEPDDWLRREIETAIDLERNIVPVLVEDFNFAQAEPYLTGKLTELKRYNALRLVHDYFDEAMTRLRNRYLKQPIYGEIEPTPAEDWDALLERVDEAVKLPEPTEEELLVELYVEEGITQFRKGQRAAAMVSYDEAIKLNPLHAIAYLWRGIAHIAGEAYDDAIADFSEAIKLNPKMVDAFRHRGNVYLALENRDAAIEDFTTLLSLDPNNMGAHLGRSTAMYHKGDYERALALDTEAIAAFPDHWVVYNNRAETYFALGKFEQAMSDFETAYMRGREQAIVIAGMAITCHALGEIEEAIAYWRALVEKDSHYLEPDWVKQELKWQAPLVDEARKLIAKLD